MKRIAPCGEPASPDKRSVFQMMDDKSTPVSASGTCAIIPLQNASADKPKVRELYRALKRRGVQPWLDAEDLELEIRKAVKQKNQSFLDWFFIYAFTKFMFAGISSQVLPSSVLPALFFCTPPHCLKKNGTLALRH